MINTDIYTMCIVKKEERILLLKRPPERGFPGYLGPGGKVDFPESIAEGAAREVFEETGLKVKNLIYKGVDGYADTKNNYRYMVFNYVATDFEGTLLEHPPEGELCWVTLDEAMSLPMQPWFKRRFPLFFEEGVFEIHGEWDENRQEVEGYRIHKM